MLRASKKEGFGQTRGTVQDNGNETAFPIATLHRDVFDKKPSTTAQWASFKLDTHPPIFLYFFPEQHGDFTEINDHQGL